MTTFLGLGVALACGLLIGLDREQANKDGKDEEFGGVRTFPLIGFLAWSTGGFALGSRVAAAFGVVTVVGVVTIVFV